ncbi:Phage_portal and Phage_Mu_F domain-containing protei [Ktedonobacteria bacterium brp13]|nr:Phage_portal and Phage_Mu_F domain-containing protei [Ktedonobacteria bacterium brp13]
MSMWTPFKSLFNREIQIKADPTYQVGMQFISPGQPIWTDRNYASFVKEGYKKCGSVYACINKIAGAAASIKWKLYTDATMTREIPEHPILDLWRHPNPRMGTAELVEQLFGYWHMDGNAYLWANRLNPKEPPVELWALHPNLIKVVAGKLDIQGYVYGWGTLGVQDFDPDEIMHLKFTSYDDKPYYGLSPLEVAMRTIDQQNAGNDWNTALMQNDGKPSAVFTSKGYLTVEQRSQVQRELRKKYSGRGNAGKPLILEADMGYQNMAIPPKELDWLQSRGFNNREIATILDVPPILVGDQTGQTYANLKEAKQSLFTENVLPKMYRTTDHLNIWLVPMYPDLKQSGAYLSYDKRDIEVLAELYTSVEQAFAESALNLWNAGGCSMRYLQTIQGMEPKKSTYLDVYKLGPTTLIREEDLEAYAMGCLEKLSAPPPVPFNQPVPGQPALPSPAKPGAVTVTEVPDDNDSDPNAENSNGDVPADSNSTDAKFALGERRRRHSALSTKVIDLTTKEEKAAYVEQLEEQRATWETEIEQRLQDYFKTERQAMAKALAACSTQQQMENAFDTTLSEQDDALKQLVYNTWYDVGKHFSEDTTKQLEDAEKAYNSHYQSKSGITSIFTSKIIQWLLSLAATKVKQITDVTRTQIKKELANGVEGGESIPEIAKRIDQLYLQQIIPNRSTVIARTEVIGASNWASHVAAEGSGLTLHKVWLATEDSRTRPAHSDADGQEVPMNEPFTVGDEELQYPGDPAGSAENIIQCRCTQFYKRVTDESDGDDEDSKAVTLAGAHAYKSVREFMRVLA